MIKYTVLPELRTVVATIKNTENDALKKIANRMNDLPFEIGDAKRYVMPSKFTVRLVCDERDEFNAEEGKKLARRKLMKNYYRSLDKKMARFIDDVLKLRDKVIK